MRNLPSLTYENVIEAINKIINGEKHNFKESTKYYLAWQGYYLAPKAVVGVAAEIVSGEEYFPKDFSSGIGTGQACNILKNLGFRIIEKKEVDYQGYILNGQKEWIDYHVENSAGLVSVYTRGSGGTLVNLEKGAPVFVVKSKSKAICLCGYFSSQKKHSVDEAWDLYGGQLGASTKGEWVKNIQKIDSIKKTGKLLTFTLADTYIFNPPVLMDDVFIKGHGAGQKGHYLSEQEVAILETYKENNRVSQGYDEDSYQKDILEQTDDLPSEPEIRKNENRQKGRLKQTPPPRNPKMGIKALQNAGFKCQANPEHITFKSSNTDNFMEKHHLIPMQFYYDYQHDIDHYHNIFSLCPICHSQIHYGLNDDKKKIITDLYNSRQKILEECYDVSLEDVLKRYDL